VLSSAPILIATIGILWLARGPRLRSVAAAAVTTIAIAELIWWNTAFRLNAEPHRDYAVLERASGPAAEALDLVERHVQARRNDGERPRVEVVGLGGPWQNVAIVRSLEAVNGYNP